MILNNTTNLIKNKKSIDAIIIITIYNSLLTQFFSLYIVTNCYQLVIGEAILSWNLVQLLLDNGSLSWPIC